MRKRIRFKKATQKELAKYLGVYESTIVFYRKNETANKKLFLMLKGLQKLKEEQELIEQATTTKLNS